MQKRDQTVFLYCFALLQNATAFGQILSITRCIVYVFSSRADTMGCQEHLSVLQDAIQTQKTDKIKFENADEDQKNFNFKDIQKSLTKSSPVFGPIEEVARQTQEEAGKEDETEGAGQPNSHYCESLVDIILHYAGTVPLWSGLMLANLCKTWDSNAFVENWFRTTKTVILTSKLHRRAEDFLQLQHEFVVGRLKGIKFVTKQVRPASTNFQDTLKPEGPDTPLSQEETWKKRSTTQKRKSKYFSLPPPAKRIRVLVAHKGAAA